MADETLFEPETIKSGNIGSELCILPASGASIPVLFAKHSRVNASHQPLQVLPLENVNEHEEGQGSYLMIDC